jgi:hypothetical protein
MVYVHTHIHTLYRSHRMVYGICTHPHTYSLGYLVLDLAPSKFPYQLSNFHINCQISISIVKFPYQLSNFHINCLSTHDAYQQHLRSICAHLCSLSHLKGAFHAAVVNDMKINCLSTQDAYQQYLRTWHAYKYTCADAHINILIHMHINIPTPTRFLEITVLAYNGLWLQ